MSLPLFLAVFSCVVQLYCSLILALGVRKLRRLDDVTAERNSPEPRVSVIMPACNEEKNIEQAVLALLGQAYGNLEILVVNDRSTDGTAQVLKGLQTAHPRLLVHEITELPPGWMGKSHALAQGATLASGEYLLFTDADVIMEPTTISRAIRHMLHDRLDHMSLFFKNHGGGWLLNCLILEMALGLLLAFRPWRVRLPGSREFIGIGAFNLVKKTAYEQVGGHASISMHPIDDLMLGKILKEQGFRQDCLLGNSFVAVPWYDTVKAMIAGLEKNTFSFVHYHISFIPPIVVFLFLVNILPFWGVIFGEREARLFWLLALTSKLGGLFLWPPPPGFAGMVPARCSACSLSFHLHHL
jgi:glycosyltransferase involved in cell wall biosynthesis